MKRETYVRIRVDRVDWQKKIMYVKTEGQDAKIVVYGNHQSNATLDFGVRRTRQFLKHWKSSFVVKLIPCVLLFLCRFEIFEL